MKKIIISGKKHADDKMYGIQCGCGETWFPTFEDLAEIIINLMNNEDILYPPMKGYKGGKMLQEYITIAMQTRKIPDKKQFKL